VSSTYWVEHIANGCHDIHHNDTQPHDIQHNDIQHSNKKTATISIKTLSIMALISLSFMLNAIYAVINKPFMLSVVMLNVVAPRRFNISRVTVLNIIFKLVHILYEIDMRWYLKLFYSYEPITVNLGLWLTKLKLLMTSHSRSDKS
jgi:hypothetical protein